MDYGKLLKQVHGMYGRLAASQDYYSRVSVWYDWYSGYVKDIHNVVNHNGVSINQRSMKTLKMAKRVCEDWASSLLNERAEITISTGSLTGRNASSIFVQGSRGTGGVLGSNNFYVQMHNSIEAMFALGTSAIVVSLSNVVVGTDGTVQDTSNGDIKLNFYNAGGIIPISSFNGVVTECAFLSSFNEGGEEHHYISAHVLENGEYVIYTTLLGKDMNEKELPDGIIGKFNTGSKDPLFTIIKPNIADNVDLNNNLGVSIFSSAIDVLASCDETYDSFCSEVKTGQRLVFMNRNILSVDTVGGKPIPPQDYKKEFFQMFGDPNLPITLDGLIKDYTPELRTGTIEEALQFHLNMLSLSVGLGSKYYSFSNGGVVTATEYAGERNDFMRNARSHANMLETAIKTIITQVLWVGKNILGKSVSDTCQVDVKVSDGIIVDDSAEKESDRLDVSSGIMSKAEYRAKWYGESLDVAEAEVNKINGVKKLTPTYIP